ncbi:MAG TPA: PilZ domain-containing protein [Pyrinomonadaceae bacterium]
MRLETESIGKSFRAIFRERRRFARRSAVCVVRLPVGVSMPNERLDPEADDDYPQPIMGHTRDLSETGLSLVLPAAQLGDVDVSRAGAPLRVVLSLPSGVIILQAATVRGETLSPEGGVLVGARIVKMYDYDRRHYEAYLQRPADSAAAGKLLSDESS